MTTQKISVEAIQKISQHIRSALVLPDSENHPGSVDNTEELPEPDSLDALGDLFKFAIAPEESTYGPNTAGRWFISTINPGAALNKLPGLKLKPGFRLVTYLYRTRELGTGITWAVPEELSTTAQLERALEKSQGLEAPPRPEGALNDWTEALEGDFSPPSYMVAAILRRELQELGALGKRCDWTHHRLFTAVPQQVKWQWRSEIPKDFSPKVLVMPDGRAAIEFFACRIVNPISIVRHVDQYPAASYTAKCLNQVIANAP